MRTILVNSYRAGLAWNITGSFLYELLKVGHQVLLLTVLQTSTYGVVGTVFSILYLTVNVASLGGEDALPAYFGEMTQSRKSFALSLPLYMGMKIPLLFLGSLIATYFLRFKLGVSGQVMPMYLITGTILFEGLRSFLRMLLHTMMYHKQATLIELLITLAYYVVVWLPFILFGIVPTVAWVFVPHLAGSVVAVLVFLYYTCRYYLTLPSENRPLAPLFWWRLCTTRLYLTSLRLTTMCFKGNFLVPFFAVTFGFTSAGIFKFASYVADAVRGVANAIIRFSGAALLARLKQASLVKKQQAFSAVTSQLASVLWCVLVFLVINATPILQLGGLTVFAHSLLPAALFLLLALLDHIGSVYVTFFTIEDETGRALAIKISELFFFAAVLTWGGAVSPLIVLASLVIIKILAILILGLTAYGLWTIVPSIRVGRVTLVAGVAFALLIYGALYFDSLQTLPLTYWWQ